MWNAEISKDGRLIIKKTHFPVIVIASLCHVYFSFLKNKTDNRAYVKSKINSWCDKEFSDMHYNFETKVIHRYFPSCVNREDFKDMVKMLRENTSQFEQYMYEDIIC